MISLITGLPGNGKTLFALWHIKEKASKEGREVYYFNIKDLTLPWTECDPEKWFDLPTGSIIVIDECQFTFPKKPNGSKLPEHYEKLAVHRHSGYDIFLITQHPTLLDNFVRQLVGQHFHAVRKFGLERNTIYEWSAANPLPQNPSSQKSAVPMKWKFPAEVYTYYKSAEAHTVKRAIPAKLILACCFVLAIPAVGYFALDRFEQRGKASTQQVDAQAGGAPLPVHNGAPGVPAFDPVEDAKRWVASQSPRVAGLPHTAPRYDEMTRPTSVPVPAMCIRRGDRCQCYTQQGTKMQIEFNQCLDIAYNGYFQDFDPDPNRRSRESERTSVSVPAATAHVPSSPSVLAFNDNSAVTPSVPIQAEQSLVQPPRRAIARRAQDGG